MYPRAFFSFFKANLEVEEEGVPLDRQHVNYRGTQVSHVSSSLWGEMEGTSRAKASGCG